MCFDLDSHPPIAPIAGGALDHEDLTLRAADGTAFVAFRARAARPSGAGVVILPDVRGLYSFYEELALRFAEAGIDALAIDYFGRTAGAAKRDADFSYMEHVQQTKLPELRADVTAAVEELRRDGRVRATFTIGFCFGGRLSYSTGTFGLDLAGTIAFYGMPVDRPAGLPGADLGRPGDGQPDPGPVRRRRPGDPARGDRRVRRGPDRPPASSTSW